MRVLFQKFLFNNPFDHSMSRNPAMNPSAEWSLSFFDWSFLWGLIADYKFWSWPLQWILFVSFFPEYTIKKIYIICTYGATNVTKSIFFFRQSSQYWKKNQMNSHTPNNLLPLCFYYFLQMSFILLGQLVSERTF